MSDSSNYWMIEFGYGEEWEGLCCVCAESAEEAESLAIDNLDSDEEIMAAQDHIDGSLEIREVWSLEDWQDEYDEDLDEEDLPEEGSVLVLDFGS